MERREYLRLLQGSAVGIAGLAGCTGQQSGGDGGGGGDGGETTTGGGDGGGGGSTTTLELWHDKGKNPNWNPAFNEAIPVANDVIEGNYELEAVPYQSTDSFQGAIRPVLGSSDGPAFFSWWAGARLRNMIENDFAQDITDVWQTHIDNGEYTESQMAPFGQGGNAYAVPALTAYWPVWYNTETFKEYGVEPPTTWDEFNQVCETILDESGGDTAPIALPLGPGWTGFIWFEDILVRKDIEAYNQLSRGEIKYTNDVVVETLQTMNDLASAGYFGDVNEAFALQLDDIPKGMENGDYAMTLMGSWVSSLWSGDLSFDTYDWFQLPPPNPDTGKLLIVEPTPFVGHAGFPDTEAVKAAADALMSTEFQQAWNEFQGFIPANRKVDTGYLPESKKKLAEAVASGEYQFPLRYWENTSPDVAVPASKTFKKAFRPNASPESVASEVERIRQDVYG